MTDGTHILIVDDSQDCIFLLKHALSKAGITLPMVYASDGAEAIQYLLRALEPGQDQTQLPKLVITDLKMPKTDGFELLEFLKNTEAFRSITPLVLSGTIEVRDIQRAHSLGAKSFMPKPSDELGWQGLVQTIVTFYNDGMAQNPYLKGINSQVPGMENSRKK